MIRFDSDYLEGCHPSILKRLEETNLEQTTGYGTDDHCRRAAELIKKEIGQPGAHIHFMEGGTQANVTMLNAALRPYQSPLCAESGHIYSHETGAAESRGIKVIPLPAEEGKISAKALDDYMEYMASLDSPEHVTMPKLVYLSQPTELGTIYSKKEFLAIRQLCQRWGLYLMVDGARLGYSLGSEENDLSLKEMAANCDLFYIGGTKVGCLFGEAVVILNDDIDQGFRWLIKQNGGLLAKGRLLGIQFEAMFEDGLYYRLGKHGCELGMKLRQGFLDAGYDLYCSSPTNQQFILLTHQEVEALKKKFGFEVQGTSQGKAIARFCTSWASKEEQVDALLQEARQVRDEKRDIRLQIS